MLPIYENSNIKKQKMIENFFKNGTNSTGGGITRKALQNKGLRPKTLKKRVSKWDKFHVLLGTWNCMVCLRACASFSSSDRRTARTRARRHHRGVNFYIISHNHSMHYGLLNDKGGCQCSTSLHN